MSVGDEVWSTLSSPDDAVLFMFLMSPCLGLAVFRYSPRTQGVLRSVVDDKVDIDLAAAVVEYIIRAMPVSSTYLKQIKYALNPLCKMM